MPSVVDIKTSERPDVDESDYLYICRSPDQPHLLNCMGCPCRDYHTADECLGNELGCGTCELIPEHDKLHNDKEWLKNYSFKSFWKGFENYSLKSSLAKWIDLQPAIGKTIKLRKYTTIPDSVWEDTTEEKGWKDYAN